MEPTAIRPNWFGEQPMRMFVPFTKKDDEKRMVYGYASTEALDSEGEVMTLEALEEALPEYMKFANIREMHDPTKAAGKAKEASIDEKGLYIGAKIVDDQAWAKVKEGVYNGFSTGGKKLEKAGNRITRIRLKEISLADRPSCPEALFDLWKSADHSQEVPNVPEPKAPEPRKVFGPLRKTLYDVTEIVKMLEALVWMRDRIKTEEAIEGHTGSKEPAMLDAAVKFFSDIAQEMLAEETAEVQAKSGGEIKEAVDRLSKIATAIEGFMGNLAKADEKKGMCEKCEKVKAQEGKKLCKECAEKEAKKEAAVKTEDLNKTTQTDPAPAPAPATAPAPAVEPAPAPAPTPVPVNEELKKQFDQQALAIAALTKELEDLKKVAVPARAAATTVLSALSKGQDTGVKEIDDLAKVQREAESKGDALTLIKHINQGIPLLPSVRNGS